MKKEAENATVVEICCFLVEKPFRSIFPVMQTRFGGSKRFSSLICTGPGPSNTSLHPLTEQTKTGHPDNLNFFKKYGSSRTRRYYSSGTRSTSKTNPPFVLPEQAVTPTSWRFFLIPGSVLAGIGGLAMFFHYNDERRAVEKVDWSLGRTSVLDLTYRLDNYECTLSALLDHHDRTFDNECKGEKFERNTIQGPIIGGPFSLIDTEGHLVTEKNLLGNWILLYFGYTSSPDVGPAEVRKMANTINTLESEQNIKVLPIFVTIDPQRDTPSQLRAYIREFDSRIVGLTGPVGAIRQMAQEYRVFFRKVDEEGDDYLVESSHNMYLINPNMEVSRSFGVEYSAEELVEAITKEIKKTTTTVPQK
ncbi:hypothetical protein OROGR_008324 [Orobanche gracilis]